MTKPPPPCSSTPTARSREEMGKFIVGQQEVIEQLVIAVLAGGHCLLEGVPGLAKTAMVRSLARIAWT